MFTKYNTEGYTQPELDRLNAELATRLNGIDDPDEQDFVEKSFADEVARRPGGGKEEKMEPRKVHVTWTNENRTGDEMIDPALAEVETGTQAYPTSRLLDGSSDRGYAEEWAEPATLPDGRVCLRMYLFDEDEIHDEDGEPLLAEDYPWDDEHVKRILLIDD